MKKYKVTFNNGAVVDCIYNDTASILQLYFKLGGKQGLIINNTKISHEDLILRLDT